MERPVVVPSGPLAARSPDVDLRRLDALCREFRIQPLESQLQACRDALRDEGAVDVAVVGRFKAGKSSFLNSLVGRPLVPVAVVPLTAVVTRLRYGPRRDRAVGSATRTGARRRSPLDRLAEFVNRAAQSQQREGGGPRRRGDAGPRRLPGHPLRGHAPAWAASSPHNTRTSMDWLPRVGAALLAVSVDQPLSEHDLTLLTRAGAKHTPEVILLVTKADLVTPEELAQVTGFIAEQVRRSHRRLPADLPLLHPSRPTTACGRASRSISSGRSPCATRRRRGRSWTTSCAR